MIQLCGRNGGKEPSVQTIYNKSSMFSGKLTEKENEMEKYNNLSTYFRPSLEEKDAFTKLNVAQKLAPIDEKEKPLSKTPKTPKASGKEEKDKPTSVVPPRFKSAQHMLEHIESNINANHGTRVERLEEGAKISSIQVNS